MSIAPDKTESLIAPYGGHLIDLLSGNDTAELKRHAEALPSIQLTARTTCDLELLANGAFSPLDRFMGEADYYSVLETMRLADGHVFPIPVTLPVSRSAGIRENDEIALRDAKNNVLAVMTVEEIYEWEPNEFAKKVLGTLSTRHPLVAEMREWGELNISGPLHVLSLPRYHDFEELRLTPAHVRARLAAMPSARPVTAFQTRNPLHRAHEEMTKRAINETGGLLLMHPVVGLTKPGDIDYYCRVRTYKTLTEKYYDRSRVLLALLPLAMRMAGPREAVWHALIRRNYGADNLIVGRDHASPGVDEHGKPFHHPYAAQELAESFSEELGVRIRMFREFVYLPDEARYEEIGETGKAKTLTLSGTQVKEDYLNKGRTLPVWFTRPEVARILEESYPRRTRQGACIWFTGLSGSGKSTTAEILTTVLLSYGRRVTLLDGDVVRTNLSAGLGFGRDDRDTNIRRIGYVASEIVRHGGIAICAAVSPYSGTRAEVREMVGENFIEVFVDTPLDVCEKRDTKGMYARARRGEIKDFTGIDDVYESPENAELTLSTTDKLPGENVRLIIDHLSARGFLELSNNDNIL